MLVKKMSSRERSMNQETIEPSDNLTEILSKEKGISDFAHALYRFTENDNQEYTDAAYLLWRLLSNQCNKITKILEAINYEVNHNSYL